jgi:hypothetical protein
MTRSSGATRPFRKGEYAWGPWHYAYGVKRNVTTSPSCMA